MQETIRRIWDEEKGSYIQIEPRDLGIYLEMKWAEDTGDFVNIYLSTKEALELIEALKLSLPK